jgi:hypothetical protein
MVALWVSMSAAVAMADSISAAPAAKGGLLTRNGDVYPEPPKPSGGEEVWQLPNTGVASESASGGTAAVVAAGAAAAALVAMRLRKPQVSPDSE